ncbi:Hypothetical predicted protein [Paramuricea clavata]|uniref:Uncharacterized protein n=1 Tax=Paramuricea clavata TaxID=317549 RepID=A0A7D9DCG7_PARCT|nr:Hypothetical predicted protein [Paramuricea clavata]
MDQTDLRSRSAEIRSRMYTHIRDTETIKRKVGQKRGRRELRESTIPSLKRSLTGTKRRADGMTREAERTVDRIGRLETQMTDMQNEFRETKAALHTGQTAYNFEMDLAAYIYPPGTVIRHGRIFTRLMDWLRDNRNTPEGREGIRRWEELKIRFGWSDNTHKSVFFKMLRCRQAYAHPIVNYALQTSGNFTRTEARHVEDIRQMTIWLNEQHNP